MAKGKRGMALTSPSRDLLTSVGNRRFGTILADPPWQFQNRTGKIAPEHRRLSRYSTLRLPDILLLPVSELVQEPTHLYLRVPNALVGEALQVMEAWRFQYKTNIIWHKVRLESDGTAGACADAFRPSRERITRVQRACNCEHRYSYSN